MNSNEQRAIWVLREKAMKNNKRDAKLDSLLGKKVYLCFYDGDYVIGILGWQDAYNSETGLKPFCYYVEKANGSHLCFRKSCVKYVSEIKED